MLGILNVPFSICEELRQAAENLLDKNKSSVTQGPEGSKLWFCTNSKKPCSPFAVKVSSQSITCDEKICIGYKMYSFCLHTVAVAVKCGTLDSYLKSLNSRNMKILTNATLKDKPKDAGKKRKSTQIRKGPANKKPSKINILVEPQNAENQTPVTSASFLQPSAPPPTHFAMPHYPPNLVQPPTVTRNVPNLPNQRPMTADPQPGQYFLTLLKFCHPNTSTCYGCGIKFCDQTLPNDMIIVSKTRRSYYDNSSNKFLISPNFSRVYFHFNENCIRRTNALFSPFSIVVPDDLTPFLSMDQINILRSSGILV